MSEDWTERYRPSSLDDVIGNPKAVADLRKWAEGWHAGKGYKKAAVLMGPPGVGKTSAALALANDMGWGTVEMNASDQRTGGAIDEIALRGSQFNTFTADGEYLDEKSGGRKLIILDEADNLFGNADRGAMPAIVRLIRGTKQPVILIVNDFYALSRKSSVIKSSTLQIRFQKPRASSISKALAAIAAAEGVSADRAALDSIAETAAGDVRAAVRDLQAISLGRDSITAVDASELSGRDVRGDMFSLMAAIFRGDDPMAARQAMRSVDESPDHIALWVDENLPREYRDRGDLVRGYENLSRADIFLGRTMRRRHFRLWAYAGDMMSAGVCSAKRNRPASRDAFRFPGYLMTMSRSRKTRQTRASACAKISATMHTSPARVASDVLPYLRLSMGNSLSLRRAVVRSAGLDEEELAYVMEADMDSDVVRSAFSHEATETAAKGGKRAEGPAEHPASQKSLFQF
ncbi:MAG: replication factor C large subunit [Thermoplasmatales archaeon]|nr:replication factor C large subunit [Thermoplasmatales archaeon]